MPLLFSIYLPFFPPSCRESKAINRVYCSIAISCFLHAPAKLLFLCKNYSSYSCQGRGRESEREALKTLGTYFQKAGLVLRSQEAVLKYVAKI